MLCFIFRLAISHAADTGKPVSAVTERHINGCVHCRDFYYLCRSLGEDLSTEAAALSRNTPSKISERIMHNIAEAGTDTFCMRVKLLPIAAAACIISFFVISIFLFPDHHAPRHEDEVDAAVADLVGLIRPDLDLTLSKTFDKPIAVELQSIVSDTESAARFLFTCVPMDVGATE